MPYYADEDEKPKRIPRKVYAIINDEKHYIDPELVRKYNLEKEETSFFTGRKLYVEKN